MFQASSGVKRSLASMLQRIGREGRSAFYAGPAVHSVVRAVQALGGTLSLADFAAHEAVVDGRKLRYDVEVSGFPSSHAGHLCLLRLSEDDYPGTTKIEQWPSWDLPIFRWAKNQGGVVGFPGADNISNEQLLALAERHALLLDLRPGALLDDGEVLERIDAGWANGYRLPPAGSGRLVLNFPRSVGQTIWLIVIALVWVVVIGQAFSRTKRRATQGGVRP